MEEKDFYGHPGGKDCKYASIPPETPSIKHYGWTVVKPVLKHSDNRFQGAMIYKF